jgi:hypothetical protein
MKKRELEAFLFFAEIKVRAKKYKNLKNPPSFPVDCLQSETTQKMSCLFLYFKKGVFHEEKQKSPTGDRAKILPSVEIW